MIKMMRFWNNFYIDHIINIIDDILILTIISYTVLCDTLNIILRPNKITASFCIIIRIILIIKMEHSHQKILHHLRKNIIDDLNIDNNIVEPLTSQGILKTDDIQIIYTGVSNEERAEKLLDILPRCGPYAFGVFHQSLKHHYFWLSDKIDNLLHNEIENNEEIDYYPGSFNMPALSPLTVTREEKLKTALKQLKPSEYIVLHGMKGFGKSCLTANTLKDTRLVKNFFSNQIYWIKFTCDRSTDEEILIQLNTLYHNVKNSEIQADSFLPLEKDSLIRFFKCYFEKQDNRNALLILDDVSNKNIIKAFDFECKTLVLTADINILQGKRFKKIEMSDGFTETETLGLFAKVLEINVNELPVEAKKIHEECKGMPLLIAMFAAQFEEFKCDMRLQPNRWRYYLDSLRKKDGKNKVIREFFKKQETIFDMCIYQLKPRLKDHYKSLAIFNEDVNITSKTLAIFWEEDIFYVDELMLDLCHKSLVAKKWNKDLNSYIYGIHDLLLCHLKRKLTQDELIEMHKALIEKYRENCDNDFSKLPDDNYIYSYIGHHLEEAKLFEEIPKIYLDFNFIQAKIMHSGLRDLLLDLKKYKKYITYRYNSEYEAHLSDIERFLQEQASIILEQRRKKCLDIIQIAMNHSSQNYVTQTAKQLAIKQTNHLYLSHDKTREYVDISLIHETPTNICTSVFTDDSNLILIGNTSGKIILWNCESMQQKVFNGHDEKDSIKKLIVSMNGDCFLSLSSAGIIKLFDLWLGDALEINDHSDMHMESPRQRQPSWSIMFRHNNLDDSAVEFSIRNEIILDMAFGYNDQYIAACSNKTIQMWNRKGELVCTIEKDSMLDSITKIAFTDEALLLHVIDESRMTFSVYSCNANYTEYRYRACYNLQLKNDKKVIFFHHIPRKDNSLIIVTEKQAICVRVWYGDTVHKYCKQRKMFIKNNSPVTYVCATITYDGEYMIVADSAGFINVWQTSVGEPIIAIYKCRVTSLDTYCLEEEGCHIICGNGNKLFYKWKFRTQSNKMLRECLFDAAVKPYETEDTYILVKGTHLKKIIVLHGNEAIAEPESIEKILRLQLSPDEKEIVYLTEKNNLMLYDITTSTSNLILKLEVPNIFLKIINIYNCNIIVCECNGILTMWRCCKQIYESNISVHVINIHKLYNDYVAIIMQNSIRTIYIPNLCEERRATWQIISQLSFNPPSDVTFSCLSHNKFYLAVLNESCQLVLYYLNENIKVSPSTKEINEEPYFNYTFASNTICCDISQNEQYIAVGIEKGQIFIFDIQKQREIVQLSFHKDPITQLFWAPTSIDVPILLSVTNNELAWWNIALIKNKNTRRSRMGIKHSMSTPSFGQNAFNRDTRIPNSQSLDTSVSSLQINDALDTDNTANTVSKYWTNKIGRDPEVPELLAVIELPPNPNTKLHVSTDFTKFVTVDMYGSINTFKLIDYNTLEI
ncbi:uncharacterized protein LOC114927905 isoform X2 [Nylanderia fulva]|uniref:uncharacterized protein LOC114927905 isoform X2 n=1 Tax=Nylanderia fulva TaxID=613905 RepID=UPI0010FB9486|nr:uncharacterized protein LOC114927905 isoform X2 [Nylanderia fulva]